MSPFAPTEKFPQIAWKQKLRRRVLKWFGQHARSLPWRETSDPYKVWVSEIMLQQTQVATVIPYYERFIDKFPDVNLLGTARVDDVLRLWEGLGYYRRARSMHGAAQLLVEQNSSQFPQTFEEVIALPGIGRYTAGAILSIALEQKQPILEGNTIRLFSRLLALRENPKTTESQKTLWEFSEQILPRKSIGAFNQGLMEIGGEVCTPRNPACDRCPLIRLCPTHALRLQKEIPAASQKMRYEEVHETAILIHRGPKILLRLCGPEQRWSGLYDVLRFPVHEPFNASDLEQQIEQETGLKIQLGEKRKTLKHTVTRFRITLDCYVVKSVRGRIAKNDAQLTWFNQEQLSELPLNVTGRKLARLWQADP